MSCMYNDSCDVCSIYLTENCKTLTAWPVMSVGSLLLFRRAVFLGDLCVGGFNLNTIELFWARNVMDFVVTVSAV